MAGRNTSVSWGNPPEPTEATAAGATGPEKRRRLDFGESSGGPRIRRQSSAPPPPAAGGIFAGLEEVAGEAGLLARLERHANELASLATLARGTLSEKLGKGRKEAEHNDLVEGMKVRLATLEWNVQALRERRDRSLVERSLEDALEANAKLTRRVGNLRRALREARVRSFDNAIAQARIVCPEFDEADHSELDPFKTAVDGVILETSMTGDEASDEETPSSGGLGGRWRS